MATQSRSGNRLFELGLGPVALALCAASSKTDQIAIAALIATHGPEAFAVHWLRHRGLPWAANLLPPPPPLKATHSTVRENECLDILLPSLAHATLKYTQV